MSGTFVLEPEAVKQLASYGVGYPEHGVAKNAQEAQAVADRVGYPVVMKIVSQDVVHKSDAGGVAVGLADAGAVGEAYEAMIGKVKKAVPGAAIEGVLICRQARAGVEVIIGASVDPVFGKVLMFGLGGIFTEILKDVTFRAIPLEPIDAKEMIEEIKGYPLLTGARGQAPCDVEKLAQTLMAISRFLMDRPDIQELDLNPVRVYPDGVEALDVRIIA